MLRLFTNIAVICLLSLAVFLSACGDGISGKLISISVQPANGTGMSTAPVPGNQVAFTAWGRYDGGVHTQSNLGNVTWTVSNPLTASISNDPTDFGTATCLAAGGPITVTATREGITGTATLICQ